MIQTDHLHEVKTYHVTKANALSVSQTLMNTLINSINTAYNAIVTENTGVDVVATVDIAILDK